MYPPATDAPAPLCVECHADTARYRHPGGRDGVCRLCLYTLTGESPDDRAEHDATSEADYQDRRLIYWTEFAGSRHPAVPALRAAYARRGIVEPARA